MDFSKVNVGRADQVIRVVLGLVLLGFALFSPWAAGYGAWVPWLAGLVGAVLLITGLTRRCPGYAVLGTGTSD
ncbi:DUF2892 domain-containing protein [Roseibacterium sp. SDUM158017]|uniref:YgaP family membrane protein n=1 Tax=Roseicyclus salinarum TaxID=3036773 RepID=UPI0024156070|nr:DUF2892 domain-containing protein [Roseibacterium sp. SDUM158017]MDG4649818.1 DUF2892 domain-containing protein [Roseibacterium sp. SDUM158017]